MKTRRLAPPLVALASLLSLFTASAQTSSAKAQPSAAPLISPAAALATRPWEYGPFFAGGKGVGNRADYTFTNAGFRLGKVISNPHLGSIVRGQFEYAGEVIPYWQAFTPPPHMQLVSYTDPATGLVYKRLTPFGGGTFTGVSLTPIILRWDLTPHHRFAPWLQGAGGLIYTTHKFPPNELIPHGGTSVWNFSPQFGIGFHYFLHPRQAITFAANAVHISSASLGDKNPGVNASVQFQIGYTWWSRRY